MADYLEIARRVAREMMADETEIRKLVVENSGSNPQGKGEEFRCPHCGQLGSWTTWIGLAKHLGQECKVWNPPGWGASA